MTPNIWPAGNAEAIAEALRTLRGGGVVLAPTETSYMLTADPGNPDAIARLFALKERPQDKALPLIAADAEQAKAVLRWDDRAGRLAGAFWPGPLTLVLPRREDGVPGFLPESPTLAVRVSSDQTARQLAGGMGVPIPSTSANRRGMPNCYSVADFLAQCVGTNGLPDLMLDAGELPEAMPSTIVALEEQGWRVLRPGPVPETRIVEVLGSSPVADAERIG